MAKKKSNRKWIIFVLLALLVFLLAAAFFRNKNKPKGIEVDVEKAEKRTIRESVSASGRIYPEVEVVISSDVSGEIVQLYVNEGDSVNAGQTLLKIDPEAYVSAVERGTADVNNAKSQLASAKAQIATNESQLAEQETLLIQAQREHNRNKKLFADGVISEVEFNQTLSQVESAQARIASAKANIRAASENVKGAGYSVRSTEALLKELKTNLGRTIIKAPNAGVVTSLSVEQGERVVGTAQMTGTEIMRISNLSTMEVQVEVSENDILKVEMNDDVEIEVDAYVDKTFKGQVTEIANSATNVAGSTSQSSLNTDQVTNFIVKVRIDSESYNKEMNHPGYAFRPGMSASVKIITDIKEDILTVPIQSVGARVIDDKNDDYKEVVFSYEADTAKMIEVATGIQDDEYIEIIDGVTTNIDIIKGPYSAISKDLKNGSELRRKEKDDRAKKES